MEAQSLCLGVVDAESVVHDAGPESTGSTEFPDLFEEIIVTVEEEGHPGGGDSRVQARVLGGLEVGDPIPQGVGDLLNGGATSFAHMVARNRNGIETGGGFLCEAKEVHRQPHGGGGVESIIPPGDELLEDVVLDRSSNSVRCDPLLPGHREEHGIEDEGGCVDGHGNRHLAEGNAFEQGLEILERVDGNPDLARFSLGKGVVGVVPDLGGEVEGHGQPRLPLFQEVAESLVRGPGG